MSELGVHKHNPPSHPSTCLELHYVKRRLQRPTLGRWGRKLDGGDCSLSLRKSRCRRETICSSSLDRRLGSATGWLGAGIAIRRVRPRGGGHSEPSSIYEGRGRCRLPGCRRSAALSCRAFVGLRCSNGEFRQGPRQSRCGLDWGVTSSSSIVGSLRGRGAGPLWKREEQNRARAATVAIRESHNCGNAALVAPRDAAVGMYS